MLLSKSGNSTFNVRCGLNHDRIIPNQLFSVHVNLVIINGSYGQFYLLVRDAANV